MPQSPIPVSVANTSATGNSWFVNETTGSDTNPGTAHAPFKTLDAAQTAAVASNNDVVYLIGSSHRTTTLTWAKAGVSLVGLTAPSINCRARISSTGATAFSPLVNVTGQGCAFVNLGTFHGGFTGATGSQVCWAEAGGRNFYSNVQFFGGGDATTAALAGMRSLTVAMAGENLFLGCAIGLNTIQRATAVNASLELISGTPRNIFRSCSFESFTSLAGSLHVLVQASGMDRFAVFDQCIFHNAVDSTGTAMSVAFTVNSAAGGSVILKYCTSVGATVYATTGPIYVDGAVPTGTTSGLAVAAT